MSSRYFGPQQAAIPHLSKHEIADLRSDVEAAFLLQQTEATKPTVSLPAGPFTGQLCWDSTASVEKVWNGAAWVSLAAAASTLAADLAAVTVGKGASMVGVYDVATLYTATNVEAALAEVMVKANAAAVAADLASVANAKGASLVGIEDLAAKITAVTVEGALAELAAKSQFDAATAITGDLTAAATVADLKPFITAIVNAMASHGIATNSMT